MKIDPGLRSWVKRITRPDPYGTERRLRERILAKLEDAPEPRALGDVVGHEFHGNQWTGGQGGGHVDVEALTARLPVTARANFAAAAQELMTTSFGNVPQYEEPKEALLIVDNATGQKLEPDPMIGTNDSVNVPMAIATQTPLSHTVIHTHPTSSPPSVDDLMISAKYNQHMTVLGENGTAYELRLTRSIDQDELAALQDHAQRKIQTAFQEAAAITDDYVVKTFKIRKEDLDNTARSGYASKYPSVKQVHRQAAITRVIDAWQHLDYPGVEFRVIPSKK